MRKRQGLRQANPVSPGPTAWDKISDQWAAVARPPTAMTKSYGASGDIWDLLRFGSPTALLSKGLITPEQFSTLIQGQASAEDPLPRYADERQELIEGPLPIQPLEDSSVEFMSELVLDPLNLVGIGSLAVGVKSAKSFLGRVFNVGQNLYSNNPRAATVELIEGLKKQVEKGKTNVARIDKKTGETVVDISYLRSPKRQKDYIDQQAMEYAGFWDFLDDHKANGRKTLSLSEVEDFWARNNLDIRETWHSQYTDNYRLEGGTNQRSVVITYHGKQPPMTAQMVENLDNIAKLQYKKSFVDLSPEEQRVLETDYHKWYPGGSVESRGHTISKKFEDSNTQLHHGKENVLFHLRMDDRVGVGEQSGEKILNVFEIQSDWYLRANREGIYDLEFYDVEMGKLAHKNNLLEEEITHGNFNNVMPVEDIAEIRAKQQTNRNKIDEFKKQQDIVSGELSAESAAPKAPFITPGKGEEWVELALKRILKMAIDGGYDRVTFGTREIQGKIYEGMIRPVSYFKVKRMKRSDDITLPKKRLAPDGTVLHQTTEVKGKDYPYYLEAYDEFGNKIEHPEGPHRTIHNFPESKLVSNFGRDVADSIIKKAKHGRKTKVYPGEGETPDMGLENLGVLYDVTIPSILKKPPFKDFGMQLEKIPMGMAINPGEIRAADNHFRIDENFLGRSNIELNDNWEQPEFFYDDVDGNRVSVDIEGLENALDGGNVTAPPGGLDVPAIMTAARNINNRLTGGTQGNLQNLPVPSRTEYQAPELRNEDGTMPAMYNNVQELVNPGGFEQRLDRYQHPMHRNRAGADARSLLEDSGVTFIERGDGVQFYIREDSPFADPNRSYYVQSGDYTTSGEYLKVYHSGGGTGVPDEVKLMREIEIAKAINVVDEATIATRPGGTENGILVDRQYINLMNPETRAIELSHIEAELQSYAIRIYPGPTPADRPRFGIFEETMGYDEAVSAGNLESLSPNMGNDSRLYTLAKRYEVAGSHRVDPYEVLDSTRAEVMPYHIEQDVDGNLPFTNEEWIANHATDPTEDAGLLDVPAQPVITPDIEYTGLQTGQQALPAPAPAQSQVAIESINWMDVASNDIHSDSHRIFEHIGSGAQEELIDLREYADTLNTEEFGNIAVEWGSLSNPTFYIGDNAYSARGVIEFDWHDLDDDTVEAINNTVRELRDTHARFVRRIQETEGTHLDLELSAPAGLLEDTPQIEFTQRAITDLPSQWSVKLNNKIKKEWGDSPPPYAFIPPGILAGEAVRQQGQQQSLLE
mgnify:FL=1